MIKVTENHTVIKNIQAIITAYDSPFVDKQLTKPNHCPKMYSIIRSEHSWHAGTHFTTKIRRQLFAGKKYNNNNNKGILNHESLPSKLKNELWLHITL